MISGKIIYFLNLPLYSNNRAMLLKPSYEAPNDSTQDIVERGITPINSNGGFWEDYLLNSVNAWEKLGKPSEIIFFEKV